MQPANLSAIVGGMTDAELIASLGRRQIAEMLGVKPDAVRKWTDPSRGIPWKFRAALQRMAKNKGKRLPANFLESRAA